MQSSSRDDTEGVATEPLFLEQLTHWREISLDSAHHIAHSGRGYLRAAIATSGGIIWWIGSWNALEVYLLPENPWVDVGCILVGIILLVLTQTFKLQAGILPTVPDTRPPTECTFGNWKAVRRVALHWGLHYLKSLTALCGSVIMWKGGYKLLDYYLLPTTLLRDILYMVLGLFLLTITDTLSGNAGLSPLSFLFAGPSTHSETQLSRVSTQDNSDGEVLAPVNE